MNRIYQFLGVVCVALGLAIYWLNPAEAPGLTSPILSINLSMVFALSGLALLLLFSPPPTRENIERFGETVRNIRKAWHGDKRSDEETRNLH